MNNPPGIFKPLGIVLAIALVTAVAAGVVPLARSLEASTPPGIARDSWIPMGDAADAAPDYGAHPAECPNARHTPLYGI